MLVLLLWAVVCAQVFDLGPVILDQKITPVAPGSMLCNQPSYDPRQNALVVGFQHGAFVSHPFPPVTVSALHIYEIIACNDHPPPPSLWERVQVDSSKPLSRTVSAVGTPSASDGPSKDWFFNGSPADRASLKAPSPWSFDGTAPQASMQPAPGRFPTN